MYLQPQKSTLSECWIWPSNHNRRSVRMPESRPQIRTHSSSVFRKKRFKSVLRQRYKYTRHDLISGRVCDQTNGLELQNPRMAMQLIENTISIFNFSSNDYKSTITDNQNNCFNMSHFAGMQ